MTFLVLASLIALGGEPFTEVEVRGNVLVPTETFLHHLGTPDHATLPAAIQRLFDTGLFEDIRFETETTPSGFRLIVLIDGPPPCTRTEYTTEGIALQEYGGRSRAGGKATNEQRTCDGRAR